jgi:transcriptional regulator with XRE-family HTH domain
MALGDRIKRQREKRRLTQTELAERAHVNQALISRLENGISASTNTDVLKRLAKVLVCTTDYLVGMNEEDNGERMPAELDLIGV